MAKENLVLLHGQVQITPKIFMKDGELTKAMFAMKVLRRPYNNGQVVANKLFFDCPLVYTKNPELIKIAATLCKGDMVDVRGVLTTQEVDKSTICPACGAKNNSPGNLVYVTPLYICRREPEISADKGLELLKERAEISNLVMVIGTLCRDPEIYTSERGQSFAQYQLAVNRKYRIREDRPEVRTDFPWVKTRGNQALEDAQYISTGSMVYISGALQTRDVVRNVTCGECGGVYNPKDNATEIIPYSTEYLMNCEYPEPQKISVDVRKGASVDAE